MFSIDIDGIDIDAPVSHYKYGLRGLCETATVTGWTFNSGLQLNSSCVNILVVPTKLGTTNYLQFTIFITMKWTKSHYMITTKQSLSGLFCVSLQEEIHTLNGWPYEIGLEYLDPILSKISISKFSVSIFKM